MSDTMPNFVAGIHDPHRRRDRLGALGGQRELLPPRFERRLQSQIDDPVPVGGEGAGDATRGHRDRRIHYRDAEEAAPAAHLRGTLRRPRRAAREDDPAQHAHPLGRAVARVGHDRGREPALPAAGDAPAMERVLEPRGTVESRCRLSHWLRCRPAPTSSAAR